MPDRLKKCASLLRCAIHHWNTDNASNIAATLAFFCAFSLAPLLIIILTCTGWLLGTDTAYSRLGFQLTSLFGPATAQTLLHATQNSQHVQGLFASVASVVSLLVGATTVLAALQQALDQIWQTARLARSGIVGWIRTRFLSLGFILALGFLLLVSLTISTGLAALRSRIANDHPALIVLVATMDFLVSLILVSGLFAVVYRYLPARKLSWSVVVLGGALTAFLFDAGRWAIGLFLAHSTQASAFGAASAFVALLLWLYYTACIFLFGAEFTACLGNVRLPERTTGSNEVTALRERQSPGSIGRERFRPSH